MPRRTEVEANVRAVEASLNARRRRRDVAAASEGAPAAGGSSAVADAAPAALPGTPAAPPAPPTRRGRRRCRASTVADERRLGDERPECAHPTARRKHFISHLIELRTRLAAGDRRRRHRPAVPVPVGQGYLRGARRAAPARAADRRDDDRDGRHRHVLRAAQGHADGGVPAGAARTSYGRCGPSSRRGSTSTSGWRCR